MIGYLIGKVIDLDHGAVILDVNGVGYRVSVNISYGFKLGEKKGLFIHEHIREDAHDLYGFFEKIDLKLFQKLILVSGVGPKVALNIMAVASTEKIIDAIETEGAGFFVAVPGIGKKVATKIILELKSKILLAEGMCIVERSDEAFNIVSALESLGYQKHEILRVFHKTPSEIKGDEEKIRWCIKNLKK